MWNRKLVDLVTVKKRRAIYVFQTFISTTHAAFNIVIARIKDPSVLNRIGLD